MSLRYAEVLDLARKADDEHKMRVRAWVVVKDSGADCLALVAFDGTDSVDTTIVATSYIKDAMIETVCVYMNDRIKVQPELAQMLANKATTALQGGVINRGSSLH